MDENSHTIGLITVLDREIKAFNELAVIEDIRKFSGHKFSCGRLNEQTVVGTRVSGDPIEIAIATQVMIDRFNPDKILFTGFARGTVPYIEKGDIIIVGYFVDPEGQKLHAGKIIESDETLIQDLRSFCGIRRTGEIGIVFGSVIKSGSFDNDDPLFRTRIQEYGAIALDNGGPAFALTCFLNNIPFVAFAIAGADQEYDRESPANIALACREIFELKGMILASMAAPSVLPRSR